MQMKRFGPWLLILISIGTVFGWKAWQQQTATNASLPAQVKGPAVILFKGDNSPSCQAIHHLVDQAAARYGQKIHFARLDWSKEVGRIMGESPAVQQKLGQALDRLDTLGGS